jgi:hypothetical protein
VDEIRKIDGASLLDAAATTIVDSIIDRTYKCKLGARLNPAMMLSLSRAFNDMGWKIKLDTISSDAGTIDCMGEFECVVTAI